MSERLIKEFLNAFVDKISGNLSNINIEKELRDFAWDWGLGWEDWYVGYIIQQVRNKNEKK